MNIFHLGIKNILSRPLNTSLSLMLLTMGVGLISLMIQIQHHVKDQMTQNVRGIDMVVGAKGSPLQLILSAVFHMDVPTGNISMGEAEKLKENRLISSTIPLSYGDSYRGYRIVGTDHQYPSLYDSHLTSGRLWQSAMEVTVGAQIARALHLKIGDTFSGEHGLQEGGETHDEHSYKVVGILAPSGSVIDQLILTATESVWEVHHHPEEASHPEKEAVDHDHSEHGHHDEEKKITAMLIQFSSPMGMVQIPRWINENTNMQAALPSYEITRLFSLMGLGFDTLNLIALVIMLVSGVSVFISLYHALKERQYEMALMRTYGASRWQLVLTIMQEGMLLSIFGFILGIFFSRMGVFVISSILQSQHQYSYYDYSFLPQEVTLGAVSLGIGLLASLLPAIRAFTINISKTLAHA